MFYNGFTLLMQIFAGITMYWVGNWFGVKRGERQMYERCRRVAEMEREYFSSVGRLK